jgi:hypothetical protein
VQGNGRRRAEVIGDRLDRRLRVEEDVVDAEQEVTVDDPEPAREPVGPDTEETHARPRPAPRGSAVGRLGDGAQLPEGAFAVVAQRATGSRVDDERGRRLPAHRRRRDEREGRLVDRGPRRLRADLRATRRRRHTEWCGPGRVGSRIGTVAATGHERDEEGRGFTGDQHAPRHGHSESIARPVSEHHGVPPGRIPVEDATMRRLLAVGVVLLGIGGYLLWRQAHRSPVPSPGSSYPDKPQSMESSASTGEHEPAAAPSSSHGAARVRADEMRERLLALIADAGPAWGTTEPQTHDASTAVGLVARGAHGEPLAPMPPAGGPTNSEGLDEQAQYIRSRLRNDLWVLVRQCYAAEKQRDPTAQGTVYLVFKILGDPSIGGVVDDVTVDPARSDIKSAPFAECVENSMMTVGFPPPPSQMDMGVEYPMFLSPSDGYPEAGF